MEAYKGIQWLRDVPPVARLTGAILTGFVDVKLYPYTSGASQGRPLALHVLLS